MCLELNGFSTSVSGTLWVLYKSFWNFKGLVQVSLEL